MIKKELKMERYLIEGKSWKGIDLKCKLRSGVCELEIEMGRGVVEREDRWYLLCGDVMGSVEHFVVECRVLESKRKEWWARLEEELVKEKVLWVFVKLEEWRNGGENRKVVATGRRRRRRG
jgi:hypothetical protein